MISVISANLTLFINIVFTHLLLTRKQSIKYTSFIFIINYLISLFGHTFCYIFLKGTVNYKYISFILGFTFIIYISLIFEESTSKKVFTMFTIWLFSNIILIICSNIISLFSITDLNLYKIFVVSSRAFIELAFIPIVYLCYRQPYKKLFKLASSKVINLISFYSIIIFLFLMNYYEVSSYMIINLYQMFNNLLFIFIIILSYMIIFTAIWYANKNMELEYKFKLIDTQIELQKQNYKTLNKSLKNFYSFKHDIRHHLLAIKTIIDAKNYTEASEYMDKFTQIEIWPNLDVLCKNFTVDSILKYYRTIAKNNNIDFNTNLNIPENINIDNLDLSVVIGNCVENSIEACNCSCDESNKYINIKADIKGSQLVVKIKNSFNGQIIKENNIIKTSKSAEGHGIGLTNVRKITEKYNGYFNVKYNENEFVVNIIMNYN